MYPEAAKNNSFKKVPSGSISIFLSLDSDNIQSFFNPHDPAPLNRRQLSHDFQQYLDASLIGAGRYTKIDFKVFCGGSLGMRYMVDPLVNTIRRHFKIKKTLKESEFNRFKKKNYFLLIVSIIIVMLCQGVLPIVLGQDHRIHSMFSNAVDVFSWVILWKPIERLIFYWNPFLKEMLLYDKIMNAKINIIESEEELINFHLEHNDAAA
jgi:hypothetical protein